MKQEEVNKIVNEVIRDERNLGQYTRNEIPIEEFIRISFQKGKLEERERIKRIIIKLREGFGAGKIWSFDEFEEQLQKEIGEEKGK